VRHPHTIRYAILGVVRQNPRGVHGYALKRQCDRILGHFWQLNFGEVYRVLDRLAADGMVDAAFGKPGSNRKVYRITDKGRTSLDSFVLEPPTDVPRPFRQELAVKLLFASAAHLRELVNLIETQRETYLEQLHLLGAQRRRLRRIPMDAFVLGLLIDGAESSVQAELAWLDHVCQKLKERFWTSTT